MKNIKLLKKDYLNAKDTILSLEEKIRKLENELEDEKKGYEKLVELRRAEKQRFLRLSSNSQTSIEPLEEIYQVLVDNLGDKGRKTIEMMEAEVEGEEPLSMSTKVKYLIQILIDLRTDLQQRIDSLESVIRKNKEINDLMKQKVESYVMIQMKQKKFTLAR